MIPLMRKYFIQHLLKDTPVKIDVVLSEHRVCKITQLHNNFRLSFLIFELLYFRWAELTRKLEFHVEVQELNESGEYAPVEVQPRNAVGTGGTIKY